MMKEKKESFVGSRDSFFRETTLTERPNYNILETKNQDSNSQTQNAIYNDRRCVIQNPTTTSASTLDHFDEKHPYSNAVGFSFENASDSCLRNPPLPFSACPSSDLSSLQNKTQVSANSYGNHNYEYFTRAPSSAVEEIRAEEKDLFGCSFSTNVDVTPKNANSQACLENEGKTADDRLAKESGQEKEESDWHVIDQFHRGNLKYSKSNNISFEVSVSNPETRSSGPLGKYTLYLVSGRMNGGSSFANRRRYRDFEWIRQQLVAALPGIFIPPIPKKQKLGRFSTHFVEDRRKGLQIFLHRIFQNPHISSLSLFKLWLQRGEGAMESLKKEIGGRALRDSLIEFKFIFNDLIQKFNYSEVYSDIFIKFKHYLNCNLSAIQSLHNLISRINSVRLMENEAFRSLPFFFNDIIKTEKNFLLSVEEKENLNRNNVNYINENVQNSLVDNFNTSSATFLHSPFHMYTFLAKKPLGRIDLGIVFEMYQNKNYFKNFDILQNAISRELEDTECMIEATNSIDKLISMKNQAQVLLEKQENLLKQIQLSNRGSLLQSIFFRKDKQTQICNLHVHIEKLKQEIETLNEWIVLSRMILVCKEIPAYMLVKLSQFDKDAEEFCEKQKIWSECEMKIWSDFYFYIQNERKNLTSNVNNNYYNKTNSHNSLITNDYSGFNEEQVIKENNDTSSNCYDGNINNKTPLYITNKDINQENCDSIDSCKN